MKVLLFLFSLIALLNAIEILNIHTSIDSSYTHMFVSWKTDQKTDTILMYGKQGNEMNVKVTGQQDSYWEKAGWNHNVAIEGLEGNTVYYFKCGNGEEWSGVYMFKTRNETVSAFNVAIFGDMGVIGSADNSKMVNNAAKNGEMDFVWHLGDISYANDHLQFEKVWDEWFDEMSTTLQTVPYMILPGNHEAGCRNILSECFKRTANFTTMSKFRMPGPESGSNTNLFYSFDYGPVHFISMSSENGYPDAPYGSDGNSQMNWIKQDLIKANQNRKNVPWIFVGSHRPIYSAGLGHHLGDKPIGNGKILQDQFEPLWKEYGVDIHFAGHVHLYERQYPTFNDKVCSTYNPLTCTAHIVSGAGGNIEGHAITQGHPAWHAFAYTKDYGYGILEIQNKTHLSWKWYTASDGILRDQVDMAKPSE